MKVVATKMGYMFGRRIRVGETFDLPDNVKMGKWMREASAEAPAPVYAAPEPNTLSELNQLAMEEKCTCGSRKKFKNCCGKVTTTDSEEA
jgi:hypothetical protein